MNSSKDTPPEKTSRQHWMSVLARASTIELERAWHTIIPSPGFTWLRRPETGLTMLRARIGGTGSQFNLGEASVTRCALRLDAADGTSLTGMSWVLGRDQRHAELAAAFDALLQDPARGPRLEQTLVRSLAASQAARREKASRKAASTKVDFFTMVRGDNA
jgi:alpha-D-ribose 1-methylphosphonate 5-triphosphate synthase subunit PhnG